MAQADTRQSGSVYLSKQLQALQADASQNPAQLWVLRGQDLWQTQCASCHGELVTLKKAVARYPKLNAQGALVNLEDQLAHLAKQGARALLQDEVLALSAALYDAAKGEPIGTTVVQPYYDQGAQLWHTRMGRINLACVHCHEQKVGRQMRADTISQAHPTGFPIYRLSWQTIGSLERRLRACYSGVQAPLPPEGGTELRALELFLKVRAQGMPLEGASIRR